MNKDKDSAANNDVDFYAMMMMVITMNIKIVMKILMMVIM